MSGFGEKLRRERESHGATLEDIARATKIGIGYLRALENDEIDALPGPAFGKFYIRAYAEALGFDPQSLIADYDRAQREPRKVPPAPPRPKRRRERWDESRPEATNARPEPVTAADDAGPVVAEAPATEAASVDEAIGDSTGETAGSTTIADAREAPVISRRATTTAVAVVAGLVLIVVTYFAFSGSGSPETRPDLEDTSAGQGAASAEVPAPEEQLSPAPVPGAGVRDPSGAVGAPDELRSAADDETAGLRVTEFGVGSRMAGRRLEGRASRFEEGTVVWFSTRVRGGSSGDRIRHVWFHGSGAVQTIELELGGPHWRTHSSKTLWGRGAWAVEARDAEGRVLARAEFTCASAS